NPKESQKRERPQTSAVSTIYIVYPEITSSFPTTLISVKIERSPNRNPDYSQFPELPLYKEILKILPKLQKNNINAKFCLCFFTLRLTALPVSYTPTG
ncbi:MAG: hypothetical protein IJ145_02015, partial [Prevotella sp.]|nr:hypothetical protein [Prevotella sp.]